VKKTQPEARGEEKDAVFSSTLFYASVGAVAGLLIVVVVVAVVCYLLVCARPRRDHVSNSSRLKTDRLSDSAHYILDALRIFRTPS